ncbi:MAG: recombinase family protein, partial [Promethearchaeota archaeon]
LYARVSSRDQKEDLDRQLNRLRDFAVANNYPVLKEIKEIGSALNGKRKIPTESITKSATGTHHFRTHR